MNPRAGGFTLIELLVTLLILAIAAASFSLLPSFNLSAQQEMERLRLALEMAGDRARLGGTAIAVDFLPQAYRFSRLDMRGYWVPLQQPTLLSRHDVSDLSWLSLRIDQRKLPPEQGMRLLFGQSPIDFELLVKTGLDARNSKTYRFTGSVTGAVRMEALP